MEATVETPPSTTPEPQSSGGGDLLRNHHFSSLSTLSAPRRERLENWHRQFFQTVSGTIADLLRIKIDFTMESLEIHSFGEFLKARGEERHSVIFRMHPEPGTWMLDMATPFAVGVLERMMGSADLTLNSPAREFTDIEEIILQEFIDSYLNVYSRQWLPKVELQPDILRQVQNLQYQRIQSPDELVLNVTIQVGSSTFQTKMNMLVPIAALEDLVISTSPSNKPTEEEMVPDGEETPMASVPVPVSIRWQGFQIKLGEVAALSVGDVLMLDNKTCENCVLWLGDIAKFNGKIIREPTKTTVTVTGNME